jgi:choline dehydrogenase-like flavoprotein
MKFGAPFRQSNKPIAAPSPSAVPSFSAAERKILQALVELYPLPHPDASVSAKTIPQDTPNAPGAGDKKNAQDAPNAGDIPSRQDIPNAGDIRDTPGTLDAGAAQEVPERTTPTAHPVDRVSDLEELVESHIAGFTPHTKRLVRFMLVGYDLTPLLSRHMKPFHLLSKESRRQWNASSATSRNLPRKEAFKGLDTLIQLIRASTPEVRKLIGYEGKPAVPVDWNDMPPAPSFPAYSYPDLQPGDMEADVVIVGSGAGGATAASVLAKAGLKVIVVEEGGFFNRDYFNAHDPLERLSNIYRDNGMTSTIGKPVISLPMGRAIGGTTVINSGTCFDTPDDVLESWSRQGIPSISPDDMRSYFDQIADVIGIGPSAPEILGKNAEILRRGADALGYRGGVIRRNARNCHGHGICCFGCPVDAKQGMHVSYLPLAAGNGATVLSNVKVIKLWIENGRATGVIARIIDPDTGESRGGLSIRARATILSAGAIYTPSLLARQRLANSSGQLGHNLVIHPGSGITALFDEELYAWQGVMQSYYVDEKIKDGILLEATFPPPGISYSAGSLPDSDGDSLTLYPHMASCGTIISDGGNGRIVLPGRSANPLVRYSLSQADTRKVVAAIAMASEIYLAAGAKEVYTGLPGLPPVKSQKDLTSLKEGRWKPGDLKLSAYHPMGSARMGSAPTNSVVDPWGRIWDLPGAWIMDASIIPSSTRVNPQVTIMAVSLRCAEAVREELLDSAAGHSATEHSTAEHRHLPRRSLPA